MKSVHSLIIDRIPLLIIAALLLSGNERIYKISGVLLNKNDDPISSQYVSLYSGTDELVALEQTDEQGRFALRYVVQSVSAGPDSDHDSPVSFKLGPSYPNPFNPHTTFPFQATANTSAVISVYDVLGQKVMETRKEISQGTHEIFVNLGGHLSQGQYLLRVQGDGFMQTQSMTYISAGIGGGTPGITLRSGGQIQSSTRNSLGQEDTDAYRVVVDESDAYLRKEIEVPAFQDYDVGVIELETRDYSVEVTVFGEGSVEQEITAAKNYEHGNLLLLTALPAEGWHFTEWGGDLDGSENPQILLVDKEKSVTALFEPLPPVVTTLEVTEIRSNSAAIIGYVDDEGDGPVTERGVCYAATENPGREDTCIAHPDGGAGSFMIELMDLSPEMDYYARAYATNKVGTAFGEQQSFRTMSLMADYLSITYPGYRYEHVNTITGSGYTAFVLRMVSQEWLTDDLVDTTEWWHWVTIIVPDQLHHSTGLLFIDAGNRNTSQPESVSSNLIKFAIESQSVVVELHNVPFQPLTFYSDGNSRQLSEDALIAYGWRIFLEGGARDEEAQWLAQIPMTIAAMRAMDATTDYLEQNGSKTVDTFVITGASKRGWTAWLTAAFDDRVVAVAPLVIDLLNFESNLEHHWQAYGEWSPAIKDYVNEGIMDWTGSAEFGRLTHHVDPYSHLDRLAMPKYIINASGDEYFLPDSWQFYWSDLMGDKWIRYIPNSGHGLLNHNTYSSLLSFYNRILKNTPDPVFDWEVVEGGFQINYDPLRPPDAVKLWQAHNPEDRDFRIYVIGEEWTSSDITLSDDGSLFVPFITPESGFTAWFVEATFGADQPFPFIITTGVVVTPDEYPFPPFVPKRPKRAIKMH